MKAKSLLQFFLKQSAVKTYNVELTESEVQNGCSSLNLLPLFHLHQLYKDQLKGNETNRILEKLVEVNEPAV